MADDPVLPYLPLSPSAGDRGVVQSSHDNRNWLTRHLNVPIATLALCALAVTGNALAIPLFYSIQFVFGSVFMFIAFSMLGALPAILVAAAGGLYTWVLWGHPYAGLVFVGECLFVIWYCRRAEKSFLFAAGLYWCLLGIPATLLLYLLVLDIAMGTAFLMAFKQMLNGVFNAAFAGIILFFFHLFQNRISTAYLISAQIRGIIFHSTLMIALVAGTIPVLQFATFKQQTQENEIQRQLIDEFRVVADFLQANPEYSVGDFNRMLGALRDGAIVEIMPLEISGTTSGEASTPKLTDKNDTDFGIDHVKSTDERSKIKSWKLGSYQLAETVASDPPVKVTVKYSAESVSEKMDSASLKFLGYLGALLLLAVLVSWGLSNLLTRPIWRLSTLLNSATNGIMTTDTEGRVEWVNRGFTRLNGYYLEDLRGKKPGKYLQGPGTDPETVARMREHLRRQEGFDEELLNYDKQGRPYWVRINCEPLISETGQLAGFIAVETDITEQRKITHLENVSSAALEQIVDGGMVDQILVTLARNVESLIPGARCAIELVSPELATDCNFDPACYFDVSGHALKHYVHCGSASLEILDSGKHSIGRLHIFYHTSHIRSLNDLEVIKRASNIVSIVIERFQVDYKLRESASVFRHASEGILLTDAAGIVVDCNFAFTAITGFEPDETRGQPVKCLLSELEAVADPGFRNEELSVSDQWVTDTWIRNKNGRTHCVRQSISTIRGKQNEIHRYVYIFNDISELKEYQSQLESMAKFDPLTKLPNRALLSDRLQQAMIHCDRMGSELAILFIDLDGFKQVNDRHGHAVGDELLKSIAGRLKAVMREGDTLSRFGGDEFVMVAPLAFEIKSCQLLLERILSVVARESRILGEEISLTASIGVTGYPQSEAIDAEQLLRQADQAMYSAKQSGKNQYCFYDADSERAVRDLFDDLKRVEEALDREEFVLFYQPKVNLKNGELIGVEALIRWQHPVRGLLSPDEFLPITEQHAVSVRVGEWVIKNAMKQILSWRRRGLELSVSVNIDPYHLMQSDFVETLQRILEAFPEILPGDFEIEIVETSLLEDFPTVAAVIDQCQHLGVSFGLDDFGTGYSSLTYLRQLPLDYLKIDMSFVRDMLDNPNDLSIVKGVIGLAKSFNLPVIAEGVETSEHRDMLLDLDCDYGQGYWLSRPISGNDLLEWATHWHPSLSPGSVLTTNGAATDMNS